MIKRIDQQIRVNKLMVDAYLKANVSNRRLCLYVQLSGYHHNRFFDHAGKSCNAGMPG